MIPYACRIVLQSNTFVQMMQCGGGMIKLRIAFTAKLIGLYDETVCIHGGIDVGSTRAVLMNKRGNVRNPAIPNTVSPLLVFRPKASEIPDQARPKKPTVRMTRWYESEKNDISIVSSD